MFKVSICLFLAFAVNLVRIVVDAKLDSNVQSNAVAKIPFIDESKSACLVGIKTQGIINRESLKLFGGDIFLVKHFFTWFDLNCLLSSFVGFFIIGITKGNDSKDIKR